MLKKSLGYELLRKGLVAKVHRLYYRKIVIEGKENLPKDEAFLIAPNHQNALMDPLAIICAIEQQPVFLTRADIFYGKLVNRLFQFFRMLPIYRQHDGGNVAERNQIVFNKVVDILSNKQPVVIFPEATHWGKRSLKPIKKGAARLAIMAEEANKWNLNLQIVPTSIFFSDYEKGKETLHVRFGKPFSVSKYQSECSLSKEKAIRAINQELSERMKREMIHIADIKSHDLILDLCHTYNPRMRKKMNLGDTQQDWFVASKKIAQKLSAASQHRHEEMKYLEHSVEDLKSQLKTNRLKNCYTASQLNKRELWKEQLRLAALAPLFICGYFLNFLPLKIPLWFAKYVKDPLFRSSYKIVLSVFLFPVYYTSLYFILNGLLSNNLISLSVTLTGILTANFSVLYALDTKAFFDKIRFHELQKTGKLADVKLTHQAIVRQVDVLIENSTVVEKHDV